MFPTYFLSSTVPSLNDEDVMLNGSAAARPPKHDVTKSAHPNETRRPVRRGTGMGFLRFAF
jgi:hypothetical protein